MTLRPVQTREADPPGVDDAQRVVRSLRDRWRAASLAATWSFPDDWWTGAVDAVLEAVIDRGDAFAPAHQLGRDRAASGVSLAEAFEDLNELGAILGPTRIDSSLFRALALGWADVTASAQIAGDCVDPLTGLATPAYLRTRLAEIYSAAERDGTEVGDRYALVVVAASQGPRAATGHALLDSAAALIGVRESLRAVFSGGETLAATGPGVSVALVGRDAFLGTRHAALRSLLDANRGATRTWIERLPPTVVGARDLLADLSR